MITPTNEEQIARWRDREAPPAAAAARLLGPGDPRLGAAHRASRCGVVPRPGDEGAGGYQADPRAVDRRGADLSLQR